MRGKKRIGALAAVTLRLAALVLALWLACMGALTLGTAFYIYDGLCDGDGGLAGSMVSGGLGRLYDDEYGIVQREKWPDIVEYRMNDAIAYARAAVSRPGEAGNYSISEHFPNIYRDEVLYCDTAVAIVGPDGEILRESGDFIYFQYVSEESYWAGEEHDVAGFSWLDLSDEADGRYARFRTTYAGTRSLYDIEVLRITGYFNGTRMEPLAIAYLTQTAISHAIEQRGPDYHIVHPDGSEEMGYTSSYTYAQLEEEGHLVWNELFDHTAQAPEGAELVTVYATGPRMVVYDEGGPVRYQEEEHDSLLALLRTVAGRASDGTGSIYGRMSVFGLDEVILFQEREIYDLSGYDPASQEPFPEPELTVFTALRASPLLMAMELLRDVYLISLGLGAIGLLLLRRSMRDQLIGPISKIDRAISDGWTLLPELEWEPLKWAELYELSEHYRQTQIRLQIDKNEIARLNTALSYAQTAERDRRRMISNIAHELKTPLAVIHSFAEGLKERIAEEKRDRYLDGILSEAERMDGMVLEMLDLSRLEAGKVRLARDDFSLAGLTRAVFGKLELAAQAKDLRVEFHFPQRSDITADEGRIGQVIENLATNAIKYTPAGGRIAVRIELGRGGVTFAMENTCAPLSDEALEKVWDSFYRADEARSSEGTGLGLAIAKRIIDLHGGRCAVRNTASGVEFRFTL